MLLSMTSFSKTLYVSTTGNNTIPYTSRSTAANKIQVAVDATQSGDAVEWQHPATNGKAFFRIRSE